MAFDRVVILNAGFKLCDGLFKHLLIKLVANLFDMAGLLVAQEVTSATQIQIMGRQFKASAQAIERLQDFETFLCLNRQSAVCGNSEERIGTRLAAPHASAKLIKCGQAKHIRTMNDKGIRAWDIKSGFNNRGR